MKKRILLATNNAGKLERFKKLLTATALDVELCIPSDFGLQDIVVEEDGKDLAENVLIKARAYLGKMSIPILANDTGFWVEGEGLIGIWAGFKLSAYF